MAPGGLQPLQSKHLGPPPLKPLFLNPSLTFGHDALHADDAAEETGCQRPRRHVLGAKAALQPDVEVLVLLGVGGINRGDEILQGTLEGDQLLKGVAQEPATQGGEKEGGDDVN